MAAPVNTYTSGDMVGIKEDVQEIIYNIDPFETPWISSMKKIKAKNVYHEWLKDELEAPSTSNKHVEGDDTIAQAVTPATRLGNYTQIMKKSATISGTDAGLSKYGRAKEMAYVLQHRMKELKTDMESTAFNNQARDAGGGATPRQMAGAGAWIKTNVNNAGAGGANPSTADGTVARTDATTETAFTQADFDLTLQEIWNEGGKPEVVYLAPSQMQIALGFTGMNNQRSTIEAKMSGKNAVIKAVDVYVTTWGTVEFVPSRHVRNQDVWIFQKDKWAWADLRPVKNEPLAKTGDSEKRQLVAECTLACLNEKAHGLVADCS